LTEPEVLRFKLDRATWLCSLSIANISMEELQELAADGEEL
jgi:hypothetical protein